MRKHPKPGTKDLRISLKEQTSELRRPCPVNDGEKGSHQRCVNQTSQGLPDALSKRVWQVARSPVAKNRIYKTVSSFHVFQIEGLPWKEG